MKRVKGNEEWVGLPFSALSTMCKDGMFDDDNYFAGYGFRLKDSKYLHLVLITGNTAHKLRNIGVKDLRDADAFYMFQGLLAIAKMPLAAAKISLKMLLPKEHKSTTVKFDSIIAHSHRRDFTKSKTALHKLQQEMITYTRSKAKSGGYV